MVSANLPALAGRQSMAVNPWRTISATTVRPRMKVRVAAGTNHNPLIDIPWFPCLAARLAVARRLRCE